MTEILTWLQNWYQSHCDGDWEHSERIRIGTIDNPGWSISINLKETKWEDLVISRELHENSEINWFSFKIENSAYHAYGDPSKLEFLLRKFKEIVEQNN